MALSPAEVALVQSIFVQNQWRDDRRFDQHDEVFDKCLKLLERLSVAERSLISTLLKEYLWVSDSDYGYIFSKEILEPNQALFRSKKQVIFVGCKQSTVTYNKSGDTISYMAKCRSVSFGITSQAIPCIKGHETLFSPNNLIVFIDDFVGSGATVCDVLDEYESRFKPKENVVVISLVALTEGKTRIESRGYRFLCPNVRAKGIADSISISDKATAYELIQSASSHLNMKSQTHYLGHGESEGLVTMMRTPNNTFPIFWTKKDKNNEDWPSPFCRY